MNTNNANDAAARYREVAGAPAAPCSLRDRRGYQDGPYTWHYPGLTIREHFAGLAMQGLASVPYTGTTHSLGDIICIDAERAVQYADALIAALSQGEGQ